VAEIEANLWRYNLAKVVVVDVTDDYECMQPPLPSDLYPVLQETYLPTHRLRDSLPRLELLPGYLYDWHESPASEEDPWVVAVVREDAVMRFIA
jgi:hypothetical protein